MTPRQQTALAAPPPTEALEDSKRLTVRLRDGGLLEPRAYYESLALERNLALAGRRAHDRSERRPELLVHLRYWSEVNRIRTGRRHRQDLKLEDWAREQLPKKSVHEFFASAVRREGVVGFELRDANRPLPADAERIAIENCRLVNSTLTGKASALSLAKTFLVNVDLGKLADAAELDTLDAEHLAAVGGLLHLRVKGRASFANCVMRGTELMLDAADTDFSWSNLARDGTKDVPKEYELDELAKESHDARIKFGEAVRFIGGRLDGTSFRRTFLQRTAFTDVSLRNVSFAGATLDEAMFEHCDLTGASFAPWTDVPNSGQAVQPERATSVSGTTFSNCRLARRSLIHATGDADVNVDVPAAELGPRRS